MSESNENSNDSSSRSGSSSVQQSSRINSSRLNFIRPSVFSNLGSSATQSEEEKSEDALIANPFGREDNSLDTSGSAGVSSSNNAESKTDDVDDKLDPLTLLNKNGLPKSNLFAQVAKSGSSSGFVFGQNVHERVVGDNLTPASKEDEAEKSSDNVSSMFAKVAESAQTAKEPDGKSLDEAAKEYEESRSAQKRKYDEVETFTGEEDETNIIDISCKLFAFVNSNWEERGRGSLRLNDSKNDKDQSRVVFRTCGNLRLVVNTKVWSKMLCDRSSQKSLRFTAIDSTGQVKIWLIMARPVDIQTLYEALHKRVELQKTLHPEEENNQNGNSNTETPKCSEEEPVAKKPVTEEATAAPESA